VNNLVVVTVTALVLVIAAAATGTQVREGASRDGAVLFPIIRDHMLKALSDAGWQPSSLTCAPCRR
jgi:hypothetical protein